MITRILKPFVVGACLLTALTTCAAAQGNDATTEPRINSLVGGSWSAHFRIEQNFTLNSFEGSVISIKKHLSGRSAIRLGLSVFSASSDRNGSVETIQTFQSGPVTESSVSHKDDWNSKDENFSLSVKYLYYPSPNNKVSPYIGLGPMISWGHQQTQENGVTSRMDANLHNETLGRDRKWSSYGGELTFGIEWFVRDDISLMSEYSLSAAKQNSKQTSYSKAVDSEPDRELARNGADETSSINIKGNGVKFGLALYF